MFFNASYIYVVRNFYILFRDCGIYLYLRFVINFGNVIFCCC